MVAVRPAESGAAWNPGGTPFCSAERSQYRHQTCTDGAHGFYAVWTDARDSLAQVYLQRVTAGGTTAQGWPVDGLRVFADAREQDYPRVAPDNAGGVYVSWCRADDFSPSVSMFLKHYESNGQPTADWPDSGVVPIPWRLNTFEPELAADGSGYVLTVWPGFDGGGVRLYMQRIGPDGIPAPGWPAAGVALPEGGDPLLVPDGSGGGILAFQSASRVRAIRVTGAGALAPGWPAEGVDLSGLESSNIVLPQGIVQDGAGGAYVLWRGVQGKLQRIAADGMFPPGWSLGGRELTDDPGPISEVRGALTADGEGGCYVAWTGVLSPLTPEGLYVQRFRADGTIHPQWPGVLRACSAHADFPSLAHRAGGGMMLTWIDNRPSGPNHSNIYFTAFDSTGRSLGWPDDGLAVTTADDIQSFPHVLDDGTGKALITWEDDRTSRDSDLYAYSIPKDPTQAVVVVPGSITANMDVVRVRWNSKGIDRGSIERKVAHEGFQGAWEVVASLTPFPDGRFVWDDPNVWPGDHIEYRLGYQFGKELRYGASLTTDVPLIKSLSLLGAIPNPTAGALRLEYQLDRAGVVVLALVDLAGRVVLSRQEGYRLPGRHSALWTEADGLPAGVYHAVLIHEGRTDSRRVVLTR